MRISDWSSDVCSSDLLAGIDVGHDAEVAVTVDGSGASHGDSRNLCPVDQGRKWPDAALRRLPESSCDPVGTGSRIGVGVRGAAAPGADARSEEHTSELQSLMRSSYAVCCLNKKQISSI